MYITHYSISYIIILFNIKGNELSFNYTSFPFQINLYLKLSYILYILNVSYFL